MVRLSLAALALTLAVTALAATFVPGPASQDMPSSDGGYMGGVLANGNIFYAYIPDASQINYNVCPRGGPCGTPMMLPSTVRSPDLVGFVYADVAYMNFQDTFNFMDAVSRCKNLTGTPDCFQISPTATGSLSGNIVLALGSRAGDVVVRVGYVSPSIDVEILNMTTLASIASTTVAATMAEIITAQVFFSLPDQKIIMIFYDQSARLGRLDCSILPSSISCGTTTIVDNRASLFQSADTVGDGTGLGAAYDSGSSTLFVPNCNGAANTNNLMVCTGASACQFFDVGPTGALCFMNNPSVHYVPSADMLFIIGSHVQEAGFFVCTSPKTAPQCALYNTTRNPPASPTLTFNLVTAITSEPSTCTVFGLSGQGIWSAVYPGCASPPPPPSPPPPSPSPSPAPATSGGPSPPPALGAASKAKESNTTPVIVGCAVGGAVVLGVVGALLAVNMRKKAAGGTGGSGAKAAGGEVSMSPVEKP
eukprot:a842419_14.p2 GENE.a842419_14~~a842419_14.p2  ORF type:complete len:487 (-),score=96.12 a842419_14:117-1550(-)